jgi:hypothetical protein
MSEMKPPNQGGHGMGEGRSAPRPNTWKYEDMFDRIRHIPYLRHKAQCHFRGEPFELTFEEFCKFWDTAEKWQARGRQRESLVLTRIDVEGPWSVNNVEIVTRYEQLTRSSFLKRGSIYNIPNRKGTPKNAK